MLPAVLLVARLAVRRESSRSGTARSSALCMRRPCARAGGEVLGRLTAAPVGPQPFLNPTIFLAIRGAVLLLAARVRGTAYKVVSNLAPLRGALLLEVGLVFVRGNQLIVLKLEPLQVRAASERLEPASQEVALQEELTQLSEAPERLETAHQLVELLQCRAVGQRIEIAVEVIDAQGQMLQPGAAPERLESTLVQDGAPVVPYNSGATRGCPSDGCLKARAPAAPCRPGGARACRWSSRSAGSLSSGNGPCNLQPCRRSLRSTALHTVASPRAAAHVPFSCANDRLSSSSEQPAPSSTGTTRSSTPGASHTSPCRPASIECTCPCCACSKTASVSLPSYSSVTRHGP
eukprot:scaffold4304_cov58-Phaeocystis_antarctica.AAC.4